MNKFLHRFVNKLKLQWLLLTNIVQKEGKDMDVIYATLIIRGFRTFAQVPMTLQGRVRDVLVELDMAHLAE